MSVITENIMKRLVYIYDLSRTNKNNTQIATINKVKVQQFVVAILNAVLHNAVLLTQT
jgi:hypothetical protein